MHNKSIRAGKIVAKDEDNIHRSMYKMKRGLHCHRDHNKLRH